MDIDTGVNDVDVDTVAPIGTILIFGEGSEAELGAVANACKTLNVNCIDESFTWRNKRMADAPMEQISGQPGSSQSDHVQHNRLQAFRESFGGPGP